MNDYLKNGLLGELLNMRPKQNTLSGLLSPPARNFLNTRDWMNRPQIPREGGAPGFKGLGFFGAVPNAGGGYSTELSAWDTDTDGKRLDFPLMVPTLSAQELQLLLSGGKPTDEIYRKAVAHALRRGRGAKDPFATQADLPVDLP